jgi:hypothetical protein
MKILVKEKGKLKAYVQVRDIIYLKSLNIAIPSFVLDKIEAEDIGNRKGIDYIEFDNPLAINYFYNQEYIVNYDEYKNLTLEQVMEKEKELNETINKYKEKINNMDKSKRQAIYDLADSINDLKYRLDSLSYIRTLKNKIK